MFNDDAKWFFWHKVKIGLCAFGILFIVCFVLFVGVMEFCIDVVPHSSGLLRGLMAIPAGLFAMQGAFALVSFYERKLYGLDRIYRDSRHSRR